MLQVYCSLSAGAVRTCQNPTEVNRIHFAKEKKTAVDFINKKRFGIVAVGETLQSPGGGRGKRNEGYGFWIVN